MPHSFPSPPPGGLSPGPASCCARGRAVAPLPQTERQLCATLAHDKVAQAPLVALPPFEQRGATGARGHDERAPLCALAGCRAPGDANGAPALSPSPSAARKPAVERGAPRCATTGARGDSLALGVDACKELDVGKENAPARPLN